MASFSYLFTSLSLFIIRLSLGIEDGCKKRERRGDKLGGSALPSSKDVTRGSGLRRGVSPLDYLSVEGLSLVVMETDKPFKSEDGLHPRYHVSTLFIFFLHSV